MRWTWGSSRHTQSFNRVHTAESELLARPGDAPAAGAAPAEAATNIAAGTHEVNLAWRHIRLWLERHAPELRLLLQSPCSEADLRDAESRLEVQLPASVRQWFSLTDGQLTGSAGGVLFGLKMHPLDEVVVMTQQWRRVAEGLQQGARQQWLITQVPAAHGADAPTASAAPIVGAVFASHHHVASLEDLAAQLHGPDRTAAPRDGGGDAAAAAAIPPQRSFPAGRIHPCYAHAAWVPLFSDQVGNCIGVDLAPPLGQHYGQVIIFGRDFDTKYLVADNFGDFILGVANDLELGNGHMRLQRHNSGDLVVGSEGELVFVDRRTQREMSYLEVLRGRSLQRWAAAEPAEPAELAEPPPAASGGSVDDFIRANLASVGPRASDETAADARTSDALEGGALEGTALVTDV